MNGCALYAAGSVLSLSVEQENVIAVATNKSVVRNMMGYSELISAPPAFSFSDLPASLP